MSRPPSSSGVYGVTDAIVGTLERIRNVGMISKSDATATASIVIVVNNTCLRSRALRNPGHSGLGLRNVRERLQVLFGAEGTLEARRLEPDRFEARLHLPLTDSCEAPPRLREAS